MNLRWFEKRLEELVAQIDLPLVIEIREEQAVDDSWGGGSIICTRIIPEGEELREKPSGGFRAVAYVAVYFEPVKFEYVDESLTKKGDHG